MSGEEPIEITAGPITVEADAAAGGRIAQMSVDGTPLLVARDDDPEGLHWGSFPMVPWAGRLRHGRFEHDGVTYQLPLSAPPHAIHGVGARSPWTVTERTGTSARLELALPRDERWPFGGLARQAFAVDAGGVTCTMTVIAEERSFPATIGWHPWFRKPTRLDVRPTAMYRRDADHIALPELVDVPAGPWDDCFVNEEPVRLRIDGVELTITSPCTHWVVYDEPHDATCIEPQTGPPDAFNIEPHIVHPGGALSATVRFAVADDAQPF